MMELNPHWLGHILLLLGALGLAGGLCLVGFPQATKATLLAFPRSRWPGRVLTAICVFWAAWVIQHAALGRFSGVKPFIPYLAIAIVGLVVWLLDELLAPRALGGLLLLVANPILTAVRWADSVWRFVPAVIAYIWVVAGCAFILHPWVFRRGVEALVVNSRRFRMAGWGQVVVGMGLLLAGLFHLR